MGAAGRRHRAGAAAAAAGARGARTPRGAAARQRAARRRSRRAWRRAAGAVRRRAGARGARRGLLVPTYPNYDSYYHLVWGARAARRLSPTSRPTRRRPSTRSTSRCARCSGSSASDADRAARARLRAVARRAGLGRRTARRGGLRPLAGRWRRAVRRRELRVPALRRARVRRLPFLALVLWAAALEARAPRRGVPVMALLALAGLLRPEAWVLAGALLAVVRGRRRRGSSLLAARASPRRCVWALVDLLVTGDPLHSLHATSELADELGRERGLGDVPGSFVSFVGATARPPVALAGARRRACWRGGCAPGRALRVPARAVRRRRASRSSRTGVAGLSILPRYLTVPASRCACSPATAARLHDAAAPGRAARAVARAAVAAAVARRWSFVGVKAPVVGDAARRAALHPRDARRPRGACSTTPRVRRGLRCGPLTFPNYRLVPDTRWHARPAARGAVGARSARRRDARRRDLRARPARGCGATASPPARARRPTCPTRASCPIARNAALRARTRAVRDALRAQPRRSSMPERSSRAPTAARSARARSAPAPTRAARGRAACARPPARAAPRPTRRRPSATSPRAPTCARPPASGATVRRPEPRVLEDPVGQPGVVERLDARTGRSRRRRRGSAARPPRRRAAAEPDEVRRARGRPRSRGRRRHSSSCHSPTAAARARGMRSRDRAQQRPVGAAAEVAERDGDDRRRRGRAPGTSRRRAARARPRGPPRARGARARRRRRTSAPRARPPRSCSSSSRSRRRGAGVVGAPRSGPSASTRARSPGAGAISARAERVLQRVEDHDRRAARRPGSVRSSRRAWRAASASADRRAAAARRRRRARAAARRRRRRGARSRSSAWSRRMKRSSARGQQQDAERRALARPLAGHPGGRPCAIRIAVPGAVHGATLKRLADLRAAAYQAPSLARRRSSRCSRCRSTRATSRAPTTATPSCCSRRSSSSQHRPAPRARRGVRALLLRRRRPRAPATRSRGRTTALRARHHDRRRAGRASLFAGPLSQALLGTRDATLMASACSACGRSRTSSWPTRCCASRSARARLVASLSNVAADRRADRRLVVGRDEGARGYCSATTSPRRSCWSACGLRAARARRARLRAPRTLGPMLRFGAADRARRGGGLRAELRRPRLAAARASARPRPGLYSLAVKLAGGRHLHRARRSSTPGRRWPTRSTDDDEARARLRARHDLLRAVHRARRRRADAARALGRAAARRAGVLRRARGAAVGRARLGALRAVPRAS